MTSNNNSTQPDPMMMFVLEYIATSTNKNINTEINLIMASMCTVSFILITTILFSYSKGDTRFLGVPISNGILFFSSLVTLLASLSISSERFFMIYVFCGNILIGILLNVYGSQVFFESPVVFEQSADVVS